MLRKLYSARASDIREILNSYCCTRMKVLEIDRDHVTEVIFCARVSDIPKILNSYFCMGMKIVEIDRDHVKEVTFCTGI